MPSTTPRAAAGRARAGLRGALRRLGPVRRAADATRRRRGLRTIRDSGWFDGDWYAEQAGDALVDGQDPVEHFLEVGVHQGLQPHPLFDPRHYLAGSARARASAADPFTEFITRGARRGDDPHPLFHTETHLARVPEASRHPGGAFGHLLAHAHEHPLPVPLAAGAPGGPRAGEGAVETARRLQREHRAVPDHTDRPRTFETFDHRAADRFVERMRRAASALPDPPTVSVVLPTRDRADVVGEAIDSALAQTWADLELLVVDDGSVDDTDEVVAARTDPRVRYLRQPPSGVSRARNLGIEGATGQIIAYLDSDNAWEPHYLEVMVGFLAEAGLRAAHAGLEMDVGGGRTEYRGQEVDLEALRERNYVDCNTFLHERSLVDEVGGFDETLRRVVDWDLILRVAAVTDIGYAPFIGARYAHGRDRDDRITLHESVGYRHVVRARHLVAWDDAPEPVDGRVSAVLVAREGPEVVAARATSLAEADVEVVVVDAGLPWQDALRLRAVTDRLDACRLVRVADPPSLPVCLDLGAAHASGAVLLLLDAAVDLDADDVRRLARAVADEGLALAQPTLLTHHGTVRSTGQVVAGGLTPVAVGHGLPGDDEALGDERARDGVEGFAFAADARGFRSLGGLDPLFVHGGGDLDLGLRAAREGHHVAWVPDVAVELRHRDTRERWSPGRADRRELRRRWGDGTEREQVPGVAAVPCGPGLAVAGLEPLPTESWKDPARWRAVHVRDRADGPRRWAIKICAAEVGERRAWGDWHFALALQRALRRRGEHVVVDCRKAWHRPGAHLDEVNLFLRGTQRFDPAPDRINLCWIISHPDRVAWDELAAYDHVFAASLTFPDELRRRHPDLAVPVEPLLQCTDPEVFHPDPDPGLAEEVLFVGNSRDVLRPIVRDAIAAGHRPAIHGGGWRGLVPDDLVRGEYLPNEQLRRHYSSARVVLNDHWPDMRAHGLLSNRLFDAAACGAHVLSDEVAGIADVFGDQVTVVADGAFPEHLPARPGATRFDVREHSFDRRAETLVRTVESLEGSR